MAAKKKEQPEQEAVVQDQEKTAQEERDKVKQEIIDLLKKTQRVGVEDLIDVMQENGFFEAPASSGGGRHSAEAGGLAQHSLNVYNTAVKLAGVLLGTIERNTEDFRNSLVLVCLLHDLGKCGDHGKKLYVPNILKTTGKQSDKKPWERNKELTNIPHAFRSVITAERWLDLTEDEEYAIMYHDGLYDRETGGMAVIQGHETKLLMLLHWADMWASRVIEGQSESEGE
jgi:23S rRNA maturation-related 3'-5' exoribonuclease YhaM